jgi:hypothetical protein
MRRGSKVICVDDTIRPEMIVSIAQYYQNWVKNDRVYTIREILQNEGIVEGVLLEEVKNDPIYIDLIDKKQEPAFGLFRFRVIEEDPMMESIEHYISML